MTRVRWSFAEPRFATEAAFVEAVRSYARDIEVELAWDATALITPDRVVTLRFLAATDAGLDDAWATITTDDPRGFTAGMLLWKTHEAIASHDCDPPPLGDHHFFEGFRFVKPAAGAPALYQVDCGS